MSNKRYSSKNKNLIAAEKGRPNPCNSCRKKDYCKYNHCPKLKRWAVANRGKLAGIFDALDKIKETKNEKDD